MMYATKIKMRPGCTGFASGLLEIDSIYISDGTSGDWYKKEVVHDHLVDDPNTIKVNIDPYPYLIPDESIHKEKFVRSAPKQKS